MLLNITFNIKLEYYINANLEFIYMFVQNG